MMSSTSSSKLAPYIMLVAVACLASTAAAQGTAAGCPDSCGGDGGIKIQYPFGIDEGCFRKGFEILCNGSVPVLAGSTTQVVPLNNLSISTAEARVMLPVAWECFFNSGSSAKPDSVWSDGDVQFNTEGVYRISNTHNQLVVVGCNSVGFTKSQRNEGGAIYSYAFATGCMSFCNNSGSAVDGACAGVGCCRVDIPPGITDNTMDFRAYDHEGMVGFSPCDYAFFVDRENYTFSRADLKMDRNRTMPVWLDWAIRDQQTCQEAEKAPGYACVSPNSECRDTLMNGPGYVCNCSKGYEGKPYVVVNGGCQDINECERGYPCRGNCKNTPGSYECTCPRGSHSANPYTEPCNRTYSLAAKIALGAVGALLIIVVLVLFSLLGKEKRKSQEEKRKAKEFFERNGGPILEKVNKIKLFKKEELNSILKNRHSLGEGGFGEVYMGHLLGGNNSQAEPVAVKRPKNVNLADHQFANEVIIQSRVLHKNIVKLIGCCLEVDIPFLVYEFVSKGSLEVLLHGQNKMSLNFIQRLQIAAQAAKGLAYLHSDITEPIQHGDVKPANILLNDDLMPKISDFGISRLITKDKKYATTVIGDMSYVDPVYMQSGKLTNKSDVYSFGVVLLELITRKNASDPGNGNLIANFCDAYTGNRVIEFLDSEIAVEENIQLLNRLSGIIKKCLDLDVNQRPEMTVVEDQLRDMLKIAQGN